MSKYSDRLKRLHVIGNVTLSMILQSMSMIFQSMARVCNTLVSILLISVYISHLHLHDSLTNRAQY